MISQLSGLIKIFLTLQQNPPVSLSWDKPRFYYFIDAPNPGEFFMSLFHAATIPAHSAIAHSFSTNATKAQSDNRSR